MARPRIAWVDQARGIGIFLVVVGHVLRGLRNGGILSGGPGFALADSWIYSFHMPLFFLLSGLFAGRQAGRGPRRYVADKLATIAYPYLVWSVLQTLVQMAIGRHTNHRVDASDLLGILVRPIMQFWFLYALLLISLMYYALRRCGLGPAGTLAAFAAFWSTQGWLSFGGWSPPYAARANGPYFALGSVLEQNGGIERLGRAPASLLAPAAALGYGLIAAWEAWSGGSAPPPALAPGLALCGIASTIALAVLLGRRGGHLAGLLATLGANSLEIFVAHTIASAGLRIALQKFLRVQDPAAHIVLGTLAGVGLPLLLSRLCRRYHAGFLFRLSPR